MHGQLKTKRKKLKKDMVLHLCLRLSCPPCQMDTWISHRVGLSACRPGAAHIHIDNIHAKQEVMSFVRIMEVSMKD